MSPDLDQKQYLCYQILGNPFEATTNGSVFEIDIPFFTLRPMWLWYNTDLALPKQNTF